MIVKYIYDTKLHYAIDCFDYVNVVKILPQYFRLFQDIILKIFYIQWKMILQMIIFMKINLKLLFKKDYNLWIEWNKFSNFKSYIKQINEHINSKNEEYKIKLADFKKNEKSYNELILSDKQNELNKLANDIKQFQLSAQNDINKKKQELYQSAIVKLKDAIKSIAKENGYRFIIDNSNGQLLYAEDPDNVENLVRKKLGIVK